jgi:alpha/beta superfamily hydrolase
MKSKIRVRRKVARGSLKTIGKIKRGETRLNKEIPISFKNERGKQLVGILHLPGIQRPPLVIICHGFNGTKTEKKFIELARALQKEGIATFRFDFEGCGDSEGKFEEMTIEKEASDLNSAFKAILKIGDLNSKRIALIGYSLGAVVVSLFIKNFKVPVKTLIFWTQAFNQKELFKVWHEKAEIREWQRKGYLIKGDKKMGRAYFQENKDKDWSFLLSEIPKIPILLIHGKKEKMCLWSFRRN